ncbi:MAG TPA: hypothetical protein VNT30_23860 [Stellaceae bacterium]|nr:hypothetical protein [Stellaceae bacterium]
MIAWIASDECSFSTGATFDLSGGRAGYVGQGRTSMGSPLARRRR